MSMNVDMLKMLYTNTVNKNNTKSSKSNTDVSSQDSFLNTLTGVLTGNTEISSKTDDSSDLLNSIISSSDDDNDSNSNSNDLLTSLILLMQQGITMQNNVVDYDNLLSDMDSSDSLNIDSISNLLLQNMQSTSSNQSYNNLESLLSSLQSQSTYQNSSNSSIETTNMQTTNAQTETDNYSIAGRVFPEEIMNNINALRQVHDNIRSKIEETRNISSRAVTSNNVNTENADGSLQDIQISLISKDSLQNNTETNNILNGSNVATEAVADNQSDFSIAVASNVDGTDEKITDDKEINNSIIDESILNVNGVDIQNNNEIIKINDESSLIRDSVINQVKDQIMLMKSDGKQTVTMQLTPENLGKLDIKMVFEKGNLSVEILTSNPKTHSLILSNMAELKSVLQNSLDDRTYMNVDNQKQTYEHNYNQNNQGSSQHQENDDRNENEYQQTYTDTSDNVDGIDFLTELTRLRNNRFNNVLEI